MLHSHNYLQMLNELGVDGEYNVHFCTMYVFPSPEYCALEEIRFKINREGMAEQRKSSLDLAPSDFI